MSKRPDKPTSVDRRRFFREMFVSAIEGAEKVGKQFAQQHQFPFHYDETNYDPPDYSHLYNPEYVVYGPPWPPRYGPPLPDSIRAERKKAQNQSVAR